MNWYSNRIDLQCSSDFSRILLITPSHPHWQNQIGGQRLREPVEAALNISLGAQKRAENDGELEGQMDDGKLKPREGAHLPKVT